MDDSEPTYNDFRREVTDKIIRLLEEGTAPWQQPWDAENSLTIPHNPTTNKSYRGGNILHLITVGMERGFTDPRWMTYKQAQAHGWQVRRGEKGSRVEYWAVKEIDKPGDSVTTSKIDSSGDHRRTRYIHRTYQVFNASQIDGVPPYGGKKHTHFEAVEAGETIMSGSGASISHDQIKKAYYNRATDSIHLPPREFFLSAPGYYGTALHELAHWTGHPSRLKRDTLNESYRFGDMKYAQEELRAELASFFLAAERGIPHDPASTAAYVDSWVKALKNDKDEIFRAAADASKITDYMLKRGRGEALTEASDLLEG